MQKLNPGNQWLTTMLQMLVDNVRISFDMMQRAT